MLSYPVNPVQREKGGSGGGLTHTIPELWLPDLHSTTQCC